MNGVSRLAFACHRVRLAGHEAGRLRELGVEPVSLTDLGPLVADRERLNRLSAAERVAEILRDRITEGFFAPGERLAEENIGAALRVSRNTLREAFRLLCHERLAVHELNRGVFVKELLVEDVWDVYQLRKLIEIPAVRGVRHAPASAIARIDEAVQDGERAAGVEDWRAVGTADLRFHQSIASLVGSPRVDSIMRGLLAELRLVFHVMGNPQPFHDAYLPRNRTIAEYCKERDGRSAGRELTSYLDAAEEQITQAYAAWRKAEPDGATAPPR